MSRIGCTSDLLERRWFAVQNACVAQRHECDQIRQSLEAAELAWRRANARLRELESLRDSLDQALAEEDADFGRSPQLRARQVGAAA
jgi:hypothetical protein